MADFCGNIHRSTCKGKYGVIDEGTSMAAIL